MPVKRNLPALLLIALLFQLSSCSQERRLATAYLKERKPESVLLLSPDFSYKYSYKVPDIPGFDSLPAPVQDSLLFYNSRLLQYVNDSVLLSDYMDALSNGLKHSGFLVFSHESAEKFINSTGSGALILNLAQLELEEYYDSVSGDNANGPEENYLKNIFITAVNYNSWFEVSKINGQDTARRMLYVTNTYTDNFQSGYRYFPLTGEAKFGYSVDSLTVKDVYTGAAYFADLYAGYIFDFLMNEYIRTHMPPGMLVRNLYTYDRFSGMIRKNKGGPHFRIQPD